mgnify:CR=1 FL=1
MINVVNTCWYYDEAPDSGIKKGINPSEMAFEGDFDTFVREALQNSNDAVKNGNGSVIFQLQELEGNRLRKFKDSIKWDNHMDHLEGVAKTGRMKKIKKFVEEGEYEDCIRVLKVEDRGCEGLNGGEEEEDSNFYALTKSVGLTHKSSDSSGGSYGLGKSVYSKFSRAGTVIYSSNPADEDSDARLFGRTMVIDHETVDGSYQGNGLFGKYDEEKGIAVSLWGDEAHEIAKNLGAEHSRKYTGTSISVVGFSDPTRQERMSQNKIHEKIRDSASKYFWPAIESKDQRLSVYVGDETNHVKPAERDEQPFVELLQAYEEQSFDEELEKEGDIIQKKIEAEVPEHYEDGETEDTEVDLVIRIAEDDADYANRLAKFRGSRMVVSYDIKNNWLGSNSFHAMLVCGEARNEPNKGDRDLEKFLKAAEPPEHDKWDSTERMRNTYKQPYKKKLDDMMDRVEKELKSAVTQQAEIGEKGAEKLSEMFPFGKAPVESETPGSSVSFSNRSGHVEDGRWHLTGKAECEEDAEWAAHITASNTDEDGGSLDKIELEDPTVNAGDARIEDGTCIIEADSDTDQVEFEVKTEELPERALRHEAINLRTGGEVNR